MPTSKGELSYRRSPMLGRHPCARTWPCILHLLIQSHLLLPVCVCVGCGTPQCVCVSAVEHHTRCCMRARQLASSSHSPHLELNGGSTLKLIHATSNTHPPNHTLAATSSSTPRTLHRVERDEVESDYNGATTATHPYAPRSRPGKLTSDYHPLLQSCLVRSSLQIPTRAPPPVYTTQSTKE